VLFVPSQIQSEGIHGALQVTELWRLEEGEFVGVEANSRLEIVKRRAGSWLQDLCKQQVKRVRARTTPLQCRCLPEVQGTQTATRVDACLELQALRLQLG